MDEFFLCCIGTICIDLFFSCLQLSMDHFVWDRLARSLAFDTALLWHLLLLAFLREIV